MVNWDLRCPVRRNTIGAGAMELKEDDKLKTPHAIEAAAEVEAARRSFKKKANRNSVIKRLEAASSSGVDAVSLLLVRRPKAVIFGVIFLTILGVGVTVACNFSLSKPTEYDWEVPDDKFTLLRDMIEDASDETDEAAALRAMCEAERVFTGLDKYQDYCVLDTAGACTPLAYSVLRVFYDGDGAARCPLLNQSAVDAGWATMRDHEAAYLFFVDAGAFERGFPCRARSIVYTGSPLAGYENLAKRNDNQYWRAANELGAEAEADLWDHYHMEGHFLKSPYDERARRGGEDITMSLPLSLFFYRCVFWIRYFSSMQMLVIFVILGVGADDVFVFSDAWHQAAPIAGDRPPAGDGAATEAYLHRRLKYAYVRALQSMMNTSFTTAVAFLATGVHPVMPISTFGIYAAVCVLVNYALAMTFTPAILVVQDRLEQARWCCWGKARCRNDGGRGPGAPRGRPGRGGVPAGHGGRRAAEARRLGPRGRARGVVRRGGLFASRLEPPAKPEKWFRSTHMFQQAFDLSDGAYGTNEDRYYHALHFVFGMDTLVRRNFDIYVPERRRGRVRYAAGFDLSPAASQDAILASCDLVENFPCSSGACEFGLLARPNTTLCFMREFQRWHAAACGASTYGLNKTTFDARLRVFRDTTAPENADLYSSWSDVIGYVDGELRYARVDARVSMDNLAPVSDKKDCLERSNALLSDVRALARGVDGLPKVFQFSRAWLWYKCQIALVHGLLVGISIAFPVAFVVLAVATQNVVLALFAITCIGCIVAGVLGLCFLCGWSLGIRESVAGVIVIGLAVDYTIHLGHMYDHGRIHENLATREDRTKYAMRKMGHTVFAGAITTAGSASLMLLCQLTFFVQMALLIVFTISFSIFMALLFFVPLLWAFGPQGDQGNLLHIWTSLRARWDRRGPDVGSLFLPDDEPDDDAAESKEDTAVVPSGDTAL
ncbi:hypothetical protein JL722_2512 [Aureococcus anophagefferens]|nr:hypothetical protein JL722_2512 [Aureococcus anophagefferens]